MLHVSSGAPLILSIEVWNGGEKTEEVAVEVIDGEAVVETVCADPATDGDRKFEDSLMLGQAPVPSRRREPVASIASLRALPEGALLYLFFHRPENATEGDLMIRASVGSMRRLCIIAAGSASNGVSFWLQPDSAKEVWPLVFYSDQPFSWSGAAQRGYDTVFLPAFSLMEAPEAPRA